MLSQKDWEENLSRWGTLRFASGRCPEYPWPWFNGQEEESSLTRRRSCLTSPGHYHHLEMLAHLGGMLCERLVQAREKL